MSNLQTHGADAQTVYMSVSGLTVRAASRNLLKACALVCFSALSFTDSDLMESLAVSVFAGGGGGGGGAGAFFFFFFFFFFSGAGGAGAASFSGYLVRHSPGKECSIFTCDSNVVK